MLQRCPHRQCIPYLQHEGREAMKTQERVRNPKAYRKAEERKERLRKELIEQTARRVKPIVEKKFHGALIAPCIAAIWQYLAEEGAIDRNTRATANRMKIHLQTLMEEAVTLAVSRGDVKMSTLDNGDIALYIWPPSM